MYKFIGLAMMSVFAMMVIPGNIDTNQSDSIFYGMATIVKNDSLGNEVFQQSIHNDLTDEGEAFLLSAAFDDGTNGPLTTAGFGAICVSGESVTEEDGTLEGETASLFDTGNAATLNDGVNLTCEEDPDGVSISSSVATIGPVTFEAGGINIDDAETINSLGICQMDEDVPAHEGFLDCETGSLGLGKLLAVVSVTATTLNTDETVDVTYTFSLASPNS